MTTNCVKVFLNTIRITEVTSKYIGKLCVYILCFMCAYSGSVVANMVETESKAITDIVSKAEFLTYKNVAEFIDHSPKVTITAAPDDADILAYGPGVMKTLTGSDCDRDGKMDDNATCNAVYYKLWLAYAR